ncbi:MAG: efflux RND transporter permease subunit [Chlamydiales bacterium]|nr:efflux RND transporter permease subunit [Chlamydiales bacterium]
MFDLTRFSIEKPRITLTFLALIVLFGIMAYQKLPKAEDPGFVVRIARVTTYFPGASPERMENLVTDKIEKVIQEIPELEYVRSESYPGLSMITVNILERYKDMRPIWDTLRRKVEKVTRDLPEGIIGPFVNDEFGDVFGTILTITGEGYSPRELKDIADDVRNELLLIDEVAKVETYGVQDERIFVEFQDAKLAKVGSSALQLRQLLESRNILTPGGTVYANNERIILEPSGNFQSLEELQNTVIHVPGQQQVAYLKDLTNISRGYVDPPERIMRASGERSIGLAISLREGGNIGIMGAKVSTLINKMKQQYPVGVQFDYAIFQPVEVARKVSEFNHNLVEALVIVLGTTLAILGIRSGLVVASIIPMTIFMTFAIMGVFGIGINQISLAALIISLGIFVDNAIVIAESIMTEYTHEKGMLETAIESTRELRLPMLTSSATTSVAFLPIFLANSAAGEYTAALFSIVTITLASSWILSLTVIPLLCVKFLKVTPNEHRTSDSPVYQKYRHLLLSMLKRQKLVLASFLVIFVASLSLFHFVPKAFFPFTDRAMFTAELDLPVGTRIERTEEVVKGIEGFLAKNKVSADSQKPGVTKWIAFIGGVAPRYILNFNPKPILPESAFLMIATPSPKDIPEMEKRLLAFCAENFPELRVTPRLIAYGPPVDSPVAIRISGKDKEKLLAIARDVSAQLAATPGAQNIRDDWVGSSKKLIVKVNQERALRAGVSSRDIAISLQTRLSGFETTQYRENDTIIPVTLRSVASDRDDLDRLESLNVYSQAGSVSVPLKQVADLELVWQPSKIHRRNGIRTITIKSDLKDGYTATQVANAIRPYLDQQEKRWPIGFGWEFGGEVETSKKSSVSIIEKLPIAGLLMALILIMQFNSFGIPVVICSTIAMGVIGVAVGLFVTGANLGFMAFLGIVSLSGIVVNHAIILLDRIVTEQHILGKPAQEAIITASQRRMRPIMLTTITVIGGLLPLWLGGGDLFRPMAISIIFGLTICTALTLGFCPVLYAFIYRVKYDQYSEEGQRDLKRKDAEAQRSY